MTKDEALKLALEALEDLGMKHYESTGEVLYKETFTAIKEALAQPEQEPVAHSVVAGALFDFMGWLTSRKERIVLSSADNASPAVEAITEFAKMRNLSLDDAKVQDWNTTPPQRTWVGLTPQERDEINEQVYGAVPHHVAFHAAIEQALREKNT